MLAGPQIFHHAIRLEHVAANLVAPRDAAFVAVKTFHLAFRLIEFQRVKFGDQHRHRGGFVLHLTALRLRRGDEAGRNVREAHGGFNFVYVLSAFAAGTIRVATDFGFRNDDVRLDEIAQFRNGVHAGKTRVATFVGIKRRNAHEPVNAAFGFAKTVGVFALDAEGDGF